MKVKSPHLKMWTGTYTGDGNPLQSITGVPFRPRFLIVYMQASYPAGRGFKSDRDGLNTSLNSGFLPGVDYLPDMIVSLDDNGFTVGDGAIAGLIIFNAPGATYTYIAFG